MSKMILMIVCSALFPVAAYSQSSITDVADSAKQLFNYVEQMPEFPGGQDSLYRFISKQIKYPVAAMHKGIEGKVVLRFVVNEDGSLGNISVARSAGDSLLNKEAMRVVSIMPLWKPGKKNGQAVKTYYMLPVVFKLKDDMPVKK
jgi:periplasmic protein TonB